MFVNVLLNTSVSNLDKPFSFLVPKELEKNIQIGKRVKVPFGVKNKDEIGLIISKTETTDCPINKIKTVIEVIDNENIISLNNIRLAKWISKRYICNLSDSIRLFMPPGITKKSNKIYNSKIKKWVCINNKEKILNEYECLKGLTSKRKEVLDFLLDFNEVEQSDLYSYFNITSAFLKWFKDNNLITIEEEIVNRDPFKEYEITRDTPLKLNDEQNNAFNKIREYIDNKEYRDILLHGITGSGKTEVYMHLIDYVLKNNKTAILLVPEISLTPQITNKFLARFGDIVAILHSRLSLGERIDEYNRIKDGKAKIVIGPRSALFAPIKNIGIVIIDEEHDGSYKSDMTPKYEAKEVAKKICQLNKVPLLLGSATPAINTYYLAQKGDIELIKLEKRAKNATLPDIQIVDLIKEPIKEGFSNITVKLYNEIMNNLSQKEQTILFLNKRGYYSNIICKTCGYTYKCPNCDVSLTYHNDKRKLMCHYCGFSKYLENVCPMCGGNKFDTNVIGTQKIEKEINDMFPDAKTIRMDYDTTNKKNGHLEIIEKFKKENIDILIGTQMIAKGHDFPNVTLVGVLNADASINMQDFRANENTYNLLTQVAGRAGRDNKMGRVLIQTYNTDNNIFKFIRDNNYVNMYESEIMYRKNLTYPPFCDIIQILVTSKFENKAIEISDNIFEYLKINMKKYVDQKIMMVYKPTMSVLSKINNEYRWKILIKCKYNEEIANSLKNLLNDYSKYKEYKINIDINGTNMY